MAKLPEMIGKYKITAEIAKGGMGAVYKAVHPTLKRFVIIKKLTLRGNAAITERFKREARIMMDFRNDRIVQVYDHFKEGNSYYIVQEFVDGMSLDKLIVRERYLPNDVTLLIFRDCCRALKHAHDRNVIHRDIKPANILLSKNGEVKLVDFGIAVSGEDSEEALTRDGMTLGTPSYMAPEQFENSKNVDKRADVYSLGVMLYEMATGKKPFPGSFSADSIALIQKGKYPSLRKANPKASPIISRIVRKAMHFKPARRYQDLSKPLKLLEKYFSKSGASTVRKRLKAMVNGQELKDSAPREHRSAAPLLTAVAAAALLLCAGGLYAYREGYFHEYLAPSRYGALVASVRVKKGFKTPDETYVAAALFLDDGAEIPRADAEFVFRENKILETANYFILETRRHYLPPGHYRMKISLENEVFWETFYLAPRTVQRGTSTAAEGLRVGTGLTDYPTLPLSVTATIRDAVSGRDIAFTAQSEVEVAGQWIPLGTAEGTLRTGMVHRFRYRHIGYHPREFDLMVAPFQTVLEIGVTLVPREGTVRVRTDTAGVELLVNGGKAYLRGGTGGGLTPVPRPDGEAVELVLPPGSHVISAKRGGAESELQILVRSDTSREVSITYDKQSKTLRLTASGQ